MTLKDTQMENEKKAGQDPVGWMMCVIFEAWGLQDGELQWRTGQFRDR